MGLWDVFISYSGEDRNSIAKPLAERLRDMGVTVWFDEYSLAVGDSVRSGIDEGISNSSYCVIILSTSYMGRGWTEFELDGICSIHNIKRNKILPVWHKVSEKQVKEFSPMLAGLSSINSEIGITAVADLVCEIVIKNNNFGRKQKQWVDLYFERIISEIQDNLVLEIFDKVHYEDICIPPLVERVSCGSVKTLLGFVHEAGDWGHVVVGEPGSGKTTALRKTALDIANDSRREVVPVYVALAHFYKRYSSEQCSDLVEYLNKDIFFETGISWSDVCAEFGEKIILLLDGWDEIPSNTIRNEIKRFIFSLKKKWILTSRPDAVVSLPRGARYKMVPLSVERIHDLLLLRIKDLISAAKIHDLILSSDTLYKLAQNPLNLSIISIALMEVDDVSGVTKTLLFERAFDVIIRQHHRHYSFYGGSGEELDKLWQIELILERLAYETVASKHGRFFTVRQLNCIAKDVLENPPSNLSSLLTGRLGIVRDRHSGRLEFFHLWYQEFLAARYIVESHELDTLKILSHEEFSCALPFAIGLHVDVKKAFELLYSVRIFNIFNYFRAIPEGGFSERQLFRLLLRGLDFCEKRGLPVRIEVANAIYEAGPTVLHCLYKILSDSGYSNYYRRACLETIVKLDTNELTIEKRLIGLIESAEEGLLWHIIEHIGLMKSEEAIPKLERLICSENAITVGDSVWACERISSQPCVGPMQREILAGKLVKKLVEGSSHVQGHALRTIGRLRLDECVPDLISYLESSSACYRWIVPQAASHLTHEKTAHLFFRALSDEDIRVVGSALASLKESSIDVIREVEDIVRDLSKNETWVAFCGASLAHLALDVLQRLYSSLCVSRPAKIYLCRHCKTEWNIDGRIQGSVDIPLCDFGIKEANCISRSLSNYDLTMIVCSTATRAIETATIYSNFLHVPFQKSPALRELDHGDWEGRILGDLVNTNELRFKDWFDDPGSLDIPGSRESAFSAQRRIMVALSSIVNEYSNENVLVVAHKHINALLLCGLKGLPLSDFKNQIVESVDPVVIDYKYLDSFFF